MKQFESYKDRQEYEEDLALNYSLLKEIDRNPNILIEKIKRKQTKALSTGSLIDMLLFDPESVPDYFYIGELPSISDNLREIVKLLVQKYDIKETLDIKHKESLLNAAEEVKYGQSYKEETLLTKIFEGCTEYHQKFVEANDRILVSNEAYMKAADVATMLISHKWSRPLLVSESSDIEILYHFRIAYKLEGLGCKSELDVVYIDHKRKEITPIDVKTGEQSFLKNYYMFKWYLQGGLYREGLESFIANLSEYTEYRVKPFLFIYADLNHSKYPTIFRMSEVWHTHATLGWESSSGYTNKGIYPLIEEASYYLREIDTKNPEFLVPMDLELNNGILNIPMPNALPF